MDGKRTSIATTRSPRHRRRILAAFLLSVAVGLVGSPPAAAAQEPATIAGTVVDPDGRPVDGARVLVDGRSSGLTGPEGGFAVAAPAGAERLTISHPAFRELTRPLDGGSGRGALRLMLQWAVSVEESVTVAGIRADDETPVTKTDLGRDDIQTLSFGQDVPALLEVTTSVTSYSESGSGTNYSYFSVRGINQSRINITLDGAPLNDPAEHALYFNNFHDLTSAADSIQVQRGVGISTVGAPAYGGSVNFVSPEPANRAGGDARLVLGSFATRRGTLGLESGSFGDGFSFGGRVSLATTDGYRDHSGSEHRTVFVRGAWQDERAALRLTGFSGREESQMAFLAVEPEVLAVNPRANPLDPAERDDFGQDFVQLKVSRVTGGNGLFTAAAYYNRADGVFRLKAGPGPEDGLLDFGIDQAFWGSTVTYGAGDERRWSSFGLHYNDFSGDHSLDAAGTRLYLNTGLKQTANAFAKTELRLGDTLLFADLGLRWARFGYRGSVDLGTVEWLFLDPRIGIRQRLNDRVSLYASAGRAQREPARLDLLAGEDDATVRHDLEAVRPESVVDVEAGVAYRTADVDLRVNLYAMEFRDEIALTGELSDIGLPLRRNADHSYRRGLELDARWRPAPGWTVLSSANLSRNRIHSWTQFTDVYAPDFTYLGSRPLTYHDVPPVLTPEIVGNLGVEWAGRDLVLGATVRHVGSSHLDNTGLDRFTAPAFTNLDLRSVVSLARLLGDGAPRLRIFVQNLLDEPEHYPSGYSYQFLVRDGAGSETLDGTRYFYPLADRHLMVTLEMDF